MRQSFLAGKRGGVREVRAFAGLGFLGVVVARRDDGAHALLLAVHHAAFDAGAGVAHVVDDAFALGDVLFHAVFGTGEARLAVERDRVDLFVINDSFGLRVHPFVHAGRLGIALLTEAREVPRDGALAVAARGEAQFKTGAQKVHGALGHDDVARIHGGLLDFVPVEGVGVDLDGLLPVRRKGEGAEREQDAGEKA